MNEQEMIKWIRTASYEDLLRKWRYEQPGSPWFKGAVGDAYNKRMRKCRESMPLDKAIEISKRVGWSQSINPRDFKAD